MSTSDDKKIEEQWTIDPLVEPVEAVISLSDTLVNMSGNAQATHYVPTDEEIVNAQGSYELAEPQYATTTLSGTQFNFSAWWQMEQEFARLYTRMDNLEHKLEVWSEHVLPRAEPSAVAPVKKRKKRATPRKKPSARKKT